VEAPDREVSPAGAGRVDKPWGHELRWAITDRYLGKLIHINRGHQLSLQYHVQKDEAIFIVSGLVDLLLEDERGEVNIHRLSPGMSARVRPGRRHRFIGVEDSDIVEVSSPEIDDVVRLEDSYGREGTSTA
jgi:oxalate decarboxylase/phosphoglucose isomerase-like protein (cupin superfamily)